MRESRFVRIAKLAYHIAQQTLPTYSHPKSRHDYTFPQRVACVMLKIYLNYTYRDLEEWLLATDQVRQVLQLTRVPDHTTLHRTFAKLSQQQGQQQGRRAAAASASERNDRRGRHHRLSQRHGKCVLSEPSREYAACVAQGRVCGRHGTPVDCGDASRAGTRFRCAVVSAVACQGASGWGTHGAFGAGVAVSGCRG